jgi:hypothetical protein
MAAMHSFTEAYLQNNFHSQTKMTLENREKEKSNPAV